MLADLQHYLKTAKTASVKELALYVRAEPNAVRGMLSLLQRKGCVRKNTLTENCGSKCVKCNPDLTEVYEWIELAKH